jgi:uncharacterized membrane protein (DUF4010 family)
MQYVVLLALSLFFGFAFEEFYGTRLPGRPGGVRTFPLLALAGAALFLIEPAHGAACIAGLLVVGLWLYGYVRANLAPEDGRVEGHFVVPTCVLLAYVLGPVTLTQPLWMPVALVVAAVLLIGSRNALHDLSAKVPFAEVLTLAQFLILVGVVLPLLVSAPAIPFTQITPFKVWLAVVAVSTLSYASYLLQRYVLKGRGLLVTAILGGLYSSTATTVVLARAAAGEGVTGEIAGGIVAATSMMYLRLIAVCAVFNLDLARALAVPLVALAVVSITIAWLLTRRHVGPAHGDLAPENPLALGTALIFAALFVLVSVLTAWVQAHFGTAGIVALAAVVGFTDIDPFVLSIAQGGAGAIGITTAVAAILIASSSNNVLKAVYAAVFSRRAESWIPVAALLALAGLGGAAAWLVAR